MISLADRILIQPPWTGLLNEEGLFYDTHGRPHTNSAWDRVFT
jgi:hypothetical protein